VAGEEVHAPQIGRVEPDDAERERPGAVLDLIQHVAAGGRERRDVLAAVEPVVPHRRQPPVDEPRRPLVAERVVEDRSSLVRGRTRVRVGGEQEEFLRRREGRELLGPPPVERRFVVVFAEVPVDPPRDPVAPLLS
jgi:hypothetical protein